MSAQELDVVHRFLAALETAAKTGDREGVYPFLAPNVEWLTPLRDLHGADDVEQSLSWLRPPETLDVEFDVPEPVDLGDGRFVSSFHELYRVKGTGAFAYARERRIELTVRDSLVTRYAMRIVG